MKRIIFVIPVLLAFVIALYAPCPAIAGNAPSLEVEKMARVAFESAIKDIKSGRYPLELSGLESQAEVERAELGEGFRIFHLNPVIIYEDASPYDPKTHVRALYSWVYLIRVDGKARTTLSVQSYSSDGKEIRKSIFMWRSLSGSGVKTTVKLAKELDGLLSAWPASFGYQYRIIENWENRMGLNTGEISGHPGLINIIELSQNGKVLGFFPLTYYTKMVLGEISEMAVAESFTTGDLLDPNKFLSEMRAGAKRISELTEKQMKIQKKAVKP